MVVKLKFELEIIPPKISGTEEEPGL